MADSIQGYRISSRDDVPALPHPTDYLRPKKGSGHPLEELHKAAADEGSNCLGREDRWVDYEEPPSDARARMMCAGCPVFEMCDTYAKVGHPAWGIWAGQVHGRSLADRED
jgi:hypothetical protein